MNKLPLIFAALLTLSFAACTEWGSDEHQVEQADTLTSEQIDSALKDLTITGVAVDGSRRNVFLQVEGDTIDYELESSGDLTWDIGDTLTLQRVKEENGDSAIHLIDVKPHH